MVERTEALTYGEFANFFGKKEVIVDLDKIDKSDEETVRLLLGLDESNDKTLRCYMKSNNVIVPGTDWKRIDDETARSIVENEGICPTANCVLTLRRALRVLVFEEELYDCLECNCGWKGTRQTVTVKRKDIDLPFQKYLENMKISGVPICECEYNGKRWEFLLREVCRLDDRPRGGVEFYGEHKSEEGGRFRNKSTAFRKRYSEIKSKAESKLPFCKL